MQRLIRLLCQASMKNIYLFIALFISADSFCQKQKKISTYVGFHVNNTIYDRTVRNNSVGFGGDLQIFMNTRTRFRPSLEFNSDIFGGTKDLLEINGKIVKSKSGTGNILAGFSYHPLDRLYINAAAGPSFYNSQVHFTVKPTIGFYFPANQLLVAKFSLTHVFQRDEISNKPFGVFNFGIALRLFRI